MPIIINEGGDIFLHGNQNNIKIANKIINKSNYKSLCLRFRVVPNSLHIHFVRSKYELDQSKEIDIKIDNNHLFILDSSLEDFEEYNYDYFIYLNKALISYVLYSINPRADMTLINYFSIALSNQYNKAYDRLSAKDKKASTIAKNIYLNKGDREVINIINNNDMSKFISYMIKFDNKDFKNKLN